MENTIVHISEINISPESGMGRVEYYWKRAFEKAGYDFIHIGPLEMNAATHPGLFPYKAFNYYRKLNLKPKALIVHEPASGYFVQKGVFCFVESHGVERRYWEEQKNGAVPLADKKSLNLKTRLLFPLWRLRGCDKGLKYAEKLLLINNDDKEYVKSKYKRHEKDIMLFRNGVHKFDLPGNTNSPGEFTILFNGSWLERKGIRTLIKAADLLHQQGLAIKYLLIGTGKDIPAVLSDWPEGLRPFVKVVPRFQQEEEPGYLQTASLFVLPSYFEGQPLSLLQAMAAGKCCITTNCCGQKDTIENGKTGLLFTAGDYKELAVLINNCYYDEAMIKEIGKHARQYVQDFTWEKVSEDVVNFIIQSSGTSNHNRFSKSA
jgi:glycosyltransferase involved in cell wall biosynthesis